MILREDRVVGSVLYGAVADGPWYVQLMRDRTDVSAFRDQIAFGRTFAEAAAPAASLHNEQAPAAAGTAVAGLQCHAA